MDGAFTVSVAGQAVLSFATVLFVTSSPRFQTGFPLSRGESMRTRLLCNPPFQMKAIPEDGAVLRTGTGPGPLCCWCLGPVQVPTLSISWHHPAPPPRQQNLLCKGYFLYTFFFFFKGIICLRGARRCGRTEQTALSRAAVPQGTSSCVAARWGPPWLQGRAGSPWPAH